MNPLKQLGTSLMNWSLNGLQKSLSEIEYDNKAREIREILKQSITIIEQERNWLIDWAEERSYSVTRNADGAAFSQEAINAISIDREAYEHFNNLRLGMGLRDGIKNQPPAYPIDEVYMTAYKAGNDRYNTAIALKRNCGG
ncbi:MAG TPA: hypothetical protein V6C65_04600 [Allocoleopsis sp.]